MSAANADPNATILPGRMTPAGSGSRAEAPVAAGVASVLVAAAVGAWLRLGAAGLIGAGAAGVDLPPAGPISAAFGAGALAWLDALLGVATIPLCAVVMAAWGARRETLVWAAAALLIAVHPGHVSASGLGTGAASATALALAAVWLARDIWSAPSGAPALAGKGLALFACLTLARGLDPGCPPVDALLGILALLAVGPALAGAWRKGRGAIVAVAALTVAAWSMGLAREGGWPAYDTTLHCGILALGISLAVLAPVGAIGALLRDARWLLILTVPVAVTAALQGSSALIHPWSAAVHCLLAAEALGALWTLSRGRLSRAAVDAGLAAVLLLLGAATWTMQVSPDTGRNWLADNIRVRGGAPDGR